MKATRIKVSVSQDGLLPQETADIVNIQFPVLPKKLLKALGFERVDNTTFVGVLPVFVNLGDKEQEIELELGVAMPEMRKKVLEILQKPFQNDEQDNTEPEKKPPATAKKSTRSTKTKTTRKTTAKKKTGTARTSSKKKDK